VFYNAHVRILLVIALAFAASDDALWWQVQNTGIDTNLRGVSVAYAPDGKYKFVVWASGTNGVIVRSTNEGSTWKQLAVEGGRDLDFRDVEAFDSNTAYVMSSGNGDKSRIYKTENGGESWELQYSDKRPEFFLDSLTCDSKTQCLALSDPVDGKFVILNTDDGHHWKELPQDKMPAALPKEGAFAASGTSLAICDLGENIYFGTGGADVARVFHSADHGRSWTASETPIASGNASSGIFSVACGGSLVVAVGGDYKEPSAAKRVAAYSQDSGATWHLAEAQPGGYRSAAAEFSGGDFEAVGPNGTDISQGHSGERMHWKHSDSLNLNAVSFCGANGWAVGPKGVVARFRAPLSATPSQPQPRTPSKQNPGAEISGRPQPQSSPHCL
jgi:photosystem II stability/assembly factor-like uncharacterized protein